MASNFNKKFPPQTMQKNANFQGITQYTAHQQHQMAETVKKSRIVSEDDLEESLMQEFNMRLKHCMSQEQTQEGSEDEEDEGKIKEAVKMEFNTLTTNGNQEEGIYEEVAPMNSSERFLYEERSLYKATNGDVPLKNGIQPPKRHIETPQEVIYDEVKSVRPVLQLPTTCLTDMSDYTEQDGQEIKSSVKDRMLLSTDDTSCLLFTQTVTSPMLTPSEENIDFLKGFQRESSQTTTNSTSENSNTQSSKVEEEHTESISDKLEEVEYENIQINTETDISEVDNIAPVILEPTSQIVLQELQQENVYEQIDDDVDDKQEEIYENMEILRKQSIEHLADQYNITREFLEREIIEEEKNRDVDNNYEDIEGTEEEDIELSNAESVEEIQKDAPEKSIPDVCLEAIEILDNQKNLVEESLLQEDQEASKISVARVETPIQNLDERPESESSTLEAEIEDKSLDNPSKMVDALKSKFLTPSTGTIECIKSGKSIEESELNQLKTVDIMKAINKFECKSPTKNEADDDENSNNSSTEMTESTYVETTHSSTIESSSSSMQDRSLKKKKSKKSRSHDKENISVPETNSNDTNIQEEEENFYNVNVKNLCRSFGDLTKIDDDRQPTKERAFRDRTKSLGDDRSFEFRKVENVFNDVSVKALRERFCEPNSTKTNKRHVVQCSESFTRLKSSFNKFDALQKKNVLHVRSSDSSTAQEKFNGAAPIDNTNCKACGKVVFQMEQIKAEKSVWHKNCFRCQECGKQLTVDTYQSNEGTVYCKPHFKQLFAPKVVEDETPPKPRKHELIIRENQPLELPPDVVRASDKPDLGLEELQSLNVRERFQVFEHHEEQQNASNVERGQVNVKRSPSILSKLAKFQSKGMDVGVTDDSLNGIPIEESSSEAEEEEEEVEGEDADLIRAKRAQKEKPFHFTGMSDVKSKWEHGDQNNKDVRREERKQEIQSIRDRLFMGKQGKMKEAYQQAVMESESCTNVRKKLSSPPPADACDTRTLKEKFEKGETYEESKRDSKEAEDMSVFESGISKKSRSIFLQLDANASKAPQLSPVSPPRVGNDVKKAREVFMTKQASEDTVKCTESLDDVKIETSDIQQRFKFFETYKEPESKKKAFRITPPREGQLKGESPEREVYRDPDIVRSEEQVEDSIIAQETHTATKVLNKFRQMEENLNKEPLNLGPKPLKRFTPPPEPARPESRSESEASGSEEDSESLEEIDQNKTQDADLLEAQKAARARQLRAKFEKWEAKEIKREQGQVNIIEEMGEEQGQIESTKALRARFESLKDSQNEVKTTPKVKVNRFVDTTSTIEVCYSCKERVYPLEKISIHEQTYHKKCFKCKECNTVLRMDSYTYNQGLLYCIPHFKRLFIAKGNYDTAFGLEQHKEKWNATVA